MANPTVISTLIELSEQASQDAAQALSEAIERHKQSKEKLDLLVQYRQEYQLRLVEKMRTGLNAQSLTNFNHFLLNLDLAIQQQKSLIDLAHERFKQAQTQWNEAERQRLSFQTLAKRHASAEAFKTLHQEQKYMDELASRAHRMTHIGS